jgi:hypothetical protein
MLKILRRVELLEHRLRPEEHPPIVFMNRLFDGNGKYSGTIVVVTPGGGVQEIFEPDVADI